MLCFGDSYIDENEFPVLLQSELGATTLVNEGISGARLEAIYDSLVTYLSTYTPAAGDFFVFWMGTNNLLDILRNPTDKIERVQNLSYANLLIETINRVQKALPSGNFLIASGHGGVDEYR